MTARRPGLDFLRAGAMALGLAYHAAFAWVPGMGRWYVVEAAWGSELFRVLEQVLHDARMQVFFALAGYFGHLVLKRRGRRGFLIERARRLLLPLLVAAPLLMLADAGLRRWAWAWGVMSETYRATTGLDVLARPLHLWFLEYLLIFVAVGAVVGARPTARAAVLRRPEVLVTLAALTWASLRWLGEPTPAFSFVPQLASVAYYLPFFAFGWWLEAAEAPERLTRASWLLLPALALSLWLHHDDALAYTVMGLALSALSSWLWVVGALGLAMKPWPSSPWLTRLVDASYWLYLVHYPVVVALQILLARVEVPFVGYLLTVVTTLVLAWVSWPLVRRTRAGRVLASG